MPFFEDTKACFKHRTLHASNSIVSIMFVLSATSETIKFDVSNCGRPNRLWATKRKRG